ncbi:MAG: hypothetical protein HC875_30060, partial [Anaerolineales bacterium]|nr:hypothetical protein [Anaerolineales bacterium]
QPHHPRSSILDPLSSPPTIGILFYRSHWLSGNTDFIDALIEAIEAGGGRARAVFTNSLKERGEEVGGEDAKKNFSPAPCPSAPLLLSAISTTTTANSWWTR